jgi:aminoglycoside phosphotransferase (APT) family kinase protein
MKQLPTAIERLRSSDPRAKPGEAFIRTIRDQYPTEQEVDSVLTRKMQRRKGPAYRVPTLEELVDGVRRLIENDLGYEVAIADPKWLSGGASKLQVVFSLRWRGLDGSADGAAVSTRMVLRTEPAASITESSRRREFQVLKAVEGIVPAPQAYWMDADAEFLPFPGIIYSFCRGVAKPSIDAGKVSGLGQNYGPRLRAKLAPQFVDMLAAIHTLDRSRFAELKHFEIPTQGSKEAVIKQVNAMRRAWEEDRLEEEPFMEVVYKWLIKNAPPLDHVSLVHGDYRNGNFLFDEETGEITSWLDWEGAVLGDRHRDLTYATMRMFGHFAEDGKTLLSSGMMAAEEMFTAYEKASGLPVDRQRLVYYTIFNMYILMVLILGAAARSAYGAQTHQDVLTNYLTGVGYPTLAEMCEYFEKNAT